VANVAIEMSGDEAKLWRSYQRVIDQQTKLQEKMKQAGDESDKAGDKAKDSADKATQGFKGQLVSMRGVVAGFIGARGMSFAIGQVQQALAHMRQESAAAVSGLQALADVRRMLTQVGTSQEDTIAMERRADDLAARHGVDRAAAGRVVFGARSENFEGSLDAIFANSRVADVEAQAGVAGQLPGLFGGQITGEQSINLVQSAATRSRLNFEGIARAMPTAAMGGNMAGSSPAEVAALVAVMSGDTAVGSQAADLTKAFGVKVGLDDRLRGRGIMGAHAALRDEFTTEERSKFLGDSQELNVFYNLLEKNAATIMQRTVGIQGELDATGTDQDAMALARGRVSPTALRAQRLDAARISMEIERERALGEAGADRIAAGDEIAGEAYARGSHGLTIYGESAGAGAAELVGGGSGAQRAGAAAGSFAVNSGAIMIAINTISEIRDALTGPTTTDTHTE